MPYDEKRPTGGIAGNLRVALPLWLLVAALAVIGVLLWAAGEATVGVVMLVGAAVVLGGGYALARALSSDRAGRQG